MELKEFKPGQDVWIKYTGQVGGRKEYKGRIDRWQVVKTGKKYLVAAKAPENIFSWVKFKPVGDVYIDIEMRGYVLFESMEAIDKEKQTNELRQEIKDLLEDCDLMKLRKVLSLIQEA